MDDAATIVAKVWPKLHDAALQGAAGKILRAVMPTTEADDVAVLVNVLAAVGVWLGPGPHLWVANCRHPPIIWPVLVGRTSAGAKGTATDLACEIVRRADASFAEHITSGLSSGEGLIELVRDGAGDHPDAKDYDPGVDDKRALVVESEYAAVLSRFARQGSTLGPVLRDAWDGKVLQVLNRKANKLIATGHHVGVIGHITPRELLDKLNAADLAGGSINRLLLVLSRRSKELPEGGNLTREASDFAVALLQAAKDKLRGGEYKRTPEAEAEWHHLYSSLLADKGEGREAQATSRAVPQVLRLSLCYALLDGSPGTIGVDHLRAAVAVWRYAEASARYVFGDPAAPEQSGEAAQLLAFITGAGDAGVTLTQVSVEHFKGHAQSHQIRGLLRSLLETGRIDQRTEKTRGAPRSVFSLRHRRT